MNKVAKSALTTGRTLYFSSDTNFVGYEIDYPIKAVESCHYEAKATRLNDYPHVAFSIEANLTVYDSRDGKPFAKRCVINDEVDVMEKEDEDGDGFIMPGGSIDLDLLALSLIVSSLPISLVRSDSELPKGGKGYNVYSEDEFASTSSKAKSSPFDALEGYETDDE